MRDLATLADNRCQQGGPTLEIAAIPETIAVLKKHFFNDLLWPDFSKIPTKLGPTISFRELTPEKTEVVAGAKVTPVLVTHTIDACGLNTATASGRVATTLATPPTTCRFRSTGESVSDSAKTTTCV